MRVHSVHPYTRPITYISSVHRPRSRNSRSVTESELRSLDLGVRERYRLHIVDPWLIYRLLHKARDSQSLLSSHRCHISWFEIQDTILKPWYEYGVKSLYTCPMIFNLRIELVFWNQVYVYFRVYIVVYMPNKIIVNIIIVINIYMWFFYINTVKKNI